MTNNAGDPLAVPSAPYFSGTNSTLHQPQVRKVLSRLYIEAERTDSQVLAEERVIASATGGLVDEQTLASLREREFMSVAPEVGRLLYLLVRTRRPARVVEFGTSFGLSAIHLAAALRDNGSGHLVTTEYCNSKVTRAAHHITQAGLADLVRLL
jgi:predicted O-methyltransferase YrrM